MEDLRLSLPADATSASIARRAILEACGSLSIDLDVLLLCTSELVTNAVLHGSPPLELVLTARESHVRVEVRDADPRLARRRDPLANDTLSGRGLGIVEAMTERWGSDHDGSGGKVTWFELARP